MGGKSWPRQRDLKGTPVVEYVRKKKVNLEQVIIRFQTRHKASTEGSAPSLVPDRQRMCDRQIDTPAN